MINIQNRQVCLFYILSNVIFDFSWLMEELNLNYKTVYQTNINSTPEFVPVHGMITTNEGQTIDKLYWQLTSSFIKFDICSRYMT